jgi:hypothetical protein
LRTALAIQGAGVRVLMPDPDLSDFNDVLMLVQLHRKRPKGGQRSLREIAAELERAGHFNERGVRYSTASVQHMLSTAFPK